MPQPVRPNATRSATWPCRSITTPKFGASRKLEALQTEVPGRERMMAEPASGDARAEHAVDRADRAADNELHQAAGQGAVPAADGSLPLTNERDHAADVTHSGAWTSSPHSARRAAAFTPLSGVSAFPEARGS